MDFKTISAEDAARLADIPLDYEWNMLINNHVCAAGFETDQREIEFIMALEELNIHGAADVAVSGAEWCMARLHKHVRWEDGRRRLQSAWAATVDPRYSMLAEYETEKLEPFDSWGKPDYRARTQLEDFMGHLGEGETCKVRQVALGTLILAEHLCGRDPAWHVWFKNIFETKTKTSPRLPDDHDYTAEDYSLPKTQELTEPSREERLANGSLDPESNPYLRPADEMAKLGFVGDPYPHLADEMAKLEVVDDLQPRNQN